MTVITVVAIAAIAALFVVFVMPRLRNNLSAKIDESKTTACYTDAAYCTKAGGCTSCSDHGGCYVCDD